ncbi:PepSY domain-containing protein [bacterium]|nr:PepSY domain-containing protein [bacterium]
MNRRWIRGIALIVALSCATGTAMVFAKSEDPDEKISGSIPIPDESVTLANLARVNLIDAVKSALAAVPGKAVSAELEDEAGFLVYSVEIVSGEKVTEVKVDAGNKRILRTEVQDECGDKGECGGKGKNEDEDEDGKGSAKKDVRDED